MSNFDYITKPDIKEDNPNWSEISNHPYRIIIVGGSGSNKTNALLKVINHELDINNFFIYTKDLCKAKYRLIISKRECTGLNYYNDPKAFIEYSNGMDNIKILKKIQSK